MGKIIDEGVKCVHRSECLKKGRGDGFGQGSWDQEPNLTHQTISKRKYDMSHNKPGLMWAGTLWQDFLIGSFHHSVQSYTALDYFVVGLTCKPLKDCSLSDWLIIISITTPSMGKKSHADLSICTLLVCLHWVVQVGLHKSKSTIQAAWPGG